MQWWYVTLKLFKSEIDFDVIKETYAALHMHTCAKKPTFLGKDIYASRIFHISCIFYHESSCLRPYCDRVVIFSILAFWNFLVSPSPQRQKFCPQTPIEVQNLPKGIDLVKKVHFCEPPPLLGPGPSILAALRRPGNNSQLSCSLARLPENFCEKMHYFKGENVKF